MTPVAQAWFNDRLLPPAKRQFDDPSHSLGYLEEYQFFDVSNYESQLVEFAWKNARSGFPCSRLAFLPAPKTWIEWHVPKERGRVGFAVSQIDNTRFARVIGFSNANPLSRYLGDMGLRDELLANGDDAELGRIPDQNEADAKGIGGLFTQLHAALVLINSQRTIARSVHGPHRGLQRKIAANPTLAGKPFNLTFHVLELEVRPPVEYKMGAEIIRGARALHFCRAYLWETRGVICPGHWRGDPARGIRVTDYNLVPARDPKYKDWTPS
jgi:hypothetical protein